MRLSVVCFMFFYEFKHNAFVHCLGAWFHAFFHIITNAYAPFVHKKAMEKKKVRKTLMLIIGSETIRS